MKNKQGDVVGEKSQNNKLRNLAVAAVVLLLLICVVVPVVIFCKPVEMRKVHFETGVILNSEDFADKKYAKGSSLQEWEEFPMIADKMFVDWYFDSGFSKQVEFPMVLDEDTTVYARFLDGNLPESFYQYDQTTDSYFVVRGTEELVESTVIPDMHDGSAGLKPVTKIVDATESGVTNSCVFGNNTTMNQIYIGNNVAYVGVGACMSCKNLKYVFVGRNSLEYGDYVFRSCTNLSSAHLPQKLTQIPKGMFYSSGIKNLDFIPSNVTKIGDWAFAYTNFTDLEIPNQIKELSYCSFAYCDALISVDTNNVTTLGEYVFYKNSNLQTAKLTNVETIGDICFCGCSSLTFICYPNVKYIGSAAFEGCTKLTPVLPEGLIWLGDYAFNHCEQGNTEIITIPSTLVQIGGDKFVGDNEENNIIPSHIFYNCSTSTLKQIKVAEGNRHFDAVDGVLYTKNYKYLISYPAAKTDERYEVLEGCQDFGEMSFSRAHFLKTLVLPNSFTIHTNLSDNFELVSKEPGHKYTNLAAAVYTFTTIEKYELKEGNTKYKEIDGIIYSIDGRELMAVPMAKARDGTLTFDENLEIMDKIVFYYHPDKHTYNGISVGGIPTKIVIGVNIKTISDDVLNYLNNEYHETVKNNFNWTLESLSPYFKVNEAGKLERVEVE